MKAACIQMDISLCNKQENVERALLMAKKAVYKGAKMIVFPEVFSTGFCYDNIAEEAEKIPSSTLETLSNFSKENNCIMIGSIIEHGGGNEIIDNRQVSPATTVDGTPLYYNTGFCIESGELCGVHRKTHLYGLEKKYFKSGKIIVPIKLPKSGLLVGLQICYELRFPEITRKLALEGSDLLVTIAEIAEPKAYHWRSLSIARSIENQIPHVACNRPGRDSYSTYFGSSLITDAWGEVKAEAGLEECILTHDIDFEQTKKVRKTISLFKDRKPELY